MGAEGDMGEPVLGSIRDVDRRDEFQHDTGGIENFNESMYLHWTNHRERTGGFIRIGNRPGEGQAEVTFMHLLSDGSVLFSFGRPSITGGNESLEVDDASIRVIAPGQLLESRFSGTVSHLRNGSVLADPPEAFRSSPRREVEFRCLHKGKAPMAITAPLIETDHPQEGFARNHYEQFVDSLGYLVLDGNPLVIEGVGLRDHSWGPRYWQAAKRYDWFITNFNDGTAVLVLSMEMASGGASLSGMYWTGLELKPITAWEREWEERPGGRKVLRFAFNAGDVSRSGHASPVDTVPLRSRRAGVTARIDEHVILTELETGAFGSGFYEVLHLVHE